jgi:hypothetical protein
LRVRIALGIVLGAVVLFVLIQLIPYGHDHTNPVVSQEVQWDIPQTRDLAIRACYDCHSNLTVWPWYSNIAPLSWLIQHDVDGGRLVLNFSEWDRQQPRAAYAADQVQSGNMPRWYYLPLHTSANLTPAEKEALIQGLRASLRQ